MEISKSGSTNEKTLTVNMRTAPTMGGMPGMTRNRGVPLSVPLPYLITGACAAAFWGLLVPWVLPQALTHPQAAQVLTLVHTATLGWLTMTIMGATFQLIPVIVVTPLHGTRFIHWQYPVYLTGVILLLIGFWCSYPCLLIIGGSLIVMAAIHYVTVLCMTLVKATTHPLTMRFLVVSCFYLCLVLSLGLTAALNLQFGFLGVGFTTIILLHIVLGVIGWLSCTLIGVSYTLVRLFSLAHAHTDRLGKIIFLCLNAGVLGLASWAIFHWLPLLLGSGAALVTTFALFAYDFRAMLKVRQRKVLDITQYHSVLAVVYAVLVLCTTVAALLLDWQQARLLTALALAALVGWIGQSIVGYLYKIVPFLVWNTRYGPLVGQQKVPLMRDLLHMRWQWLSFWLINGSLPLVIACALLNQILPLQICSGLLGAGLILAAANIVQATLHLLPARQVLLPHLL